MKKAIFGALLLGSVVVQHASAAVRTFEFTATVSSVMDRETGETSMIDGPLAGTTVSAGDLLKGEFSFDDLGGDWATGQSEVRNVPMISFSYTFLSSGATYEVSEPKWNFYPDYWGISKFEASPRDFKPDVYLDIDSPLNQFSWELGNGTIGYLGAMWYKDGPMFSSMGADLTSLSEVSAVPEPATYAMLLAGLAAVGAGAYRRKSAQKQA